jgi:hypothetical protein
MKEVKAILKEHSETLREHGESIAALKVHTKYNISNSPNIPSERGKKLLEVSGFDEIYPKIRQEIFAFIEGKQPKTLYDYEKAAEDALRSLRDDPLFYRLKDYVVNHEDESLALIFRVASWIVRDDYLKEHPLPPRPGK